MNKIEALIAQQGLTMKAASIKAGLGETYVRDMLRGRSTPTVAKLEALATALGTSIPELLNSPDDQDRTKSANNPDLAIVKLSGKVSSNRWFSRDDDPELKDIGLVPSAPGYPQDGQFALQVDGNLLGDTARHGDFLICIQANENSKEIRDGDLVVVHRTRFDGQMSELTARRLRQTSSRLELWAEEDTATSAPFVLPDPEVTIIGKVLWIARRP